MLSVLPAVLDPDAAAMVRLVRGSNQPSLWERGVEGARAYIHERAAAASPGPRIDHVEDLHIPTPAGALPARLYRPAADSPMPTVVVIRRFSPLSAHVQLWGLIQSWLL